MSSVPRDLSSVVTAYDVRGHVPGQLDATVAAALGAAFATTVVLPEVSSGEKPRVVVGYDMRRSGPALADAYAGALTAAGIDVEIIGPCSTDMLYHASGVAGIPGTMVTASREPLDLNGFKLCRAGARPVGRGSGLEELQAVAEGVLAGDPAPTADVPGDVTRRSTLTGYATFLRGLVDVEHVRPLRVVVDAGHGMAGLTVPAVLGRAADLPRVPIKVLPLRLEHDGDPDRPVNDPSAEGGLAALCEEVVAEGADIGLAFDADADRVIVVDENGVPVSASALTALIGLRLVARESMERRTATVIHDLVTSRVVPDLVSATGATAVRTRVGHSYVKAEMDAHDAVFGGEHSAHYYFRDFFFADTGMLAALHVLAALGSQPHPMSALAEMYEPYSADAIDLPMTPEQMARASERVVAAYVHERGAGDVEVDELDGLTVSHWAAMPQWWFNLRPANTEPVLRFVVEAADEDMLTKVRDDVLTLLRAQD